MEDGQMLEAAETLILCSLSSPLKTCDLWSPNRPWEEESLEAIPSFLPSWKGLRSKRSRCSCISKPATEEDDSSDPAAKTRPSPTTPLDFCTTSAPSTSGSDDAPSSQAIPEPNRRRAGDLSPPLGDDVYQKGSAASVSLMVGVPIGPIPSSKPIRRQGKKKTISELQAQERSLADENTMLRKRVETKRKEMEALMASNRRLRDEKSSLQQSRAEAAKTACFLPDLNEPATEL